jgi:hypothetical protein
LNTFSLGEGEHLNQNVESSIGKLLRVTERKVLSSWAELWGEVGDGLENRACGLEQWWSSIGLPHPRTR